MIKRYLDIDGEDADNLSFNDIIRTANEKNLLLNNLEKWNNYRLKRNITSHTYDEAKAQDIISVVDDFYKEVIFLYSEIEKRND